MISVIMPVYNAAAFLRDAVESILNQTEQDFELIIVNDGSTDDSEEIILSYQDPRIVYVKQENQGEAAARNHGLELARGEWIAWQDADDLSVATRLEVLKFQFTSDDIGFAHSDMMLINERNEPIGYWQSRAIERQRLMRFFLKIGTPYNNPSMMIRRSVLGNMRYKRQYKVGTDTDMVFRFAPHWNGVHVPEPLVLYRRHSNNASNTKDYQQLYTHVQDFLNEQSLEALVPEAYASERSGADQEATARAIVSLFLFRRGMSVDGKQWFERALQVATSDETRQLVMAIGNYAIGEYEKALGQLFELRNKDHIVENYIGEIFAAAVGDKNQAYYHFDRALKLNPHYEEALTNLKALGAGQHYNLIDVSWQKFGRKQA